MRRPLRDAFVWHHPEGWGQAPPSIFEDAGAACRIESFRSSSRFVVGAEAPTESARGVRKFASHHVVLTRKPRRPGLWSGVATVAQAWCKTRNQKVDGASLGVRFPFGVSQLGKS